ncbi:uncharacterized protein LOC123559955 [Mercenaria mercenaria]|uniref:uncharacterized protein LOC123559955 n=1 Tax=Mercenaria mercenaria TaxID=6596 RepID=UPI00234E5990|nr:uncharacterized protein LOC123559955 [Mercenaria mercenaria]
MDTSGNTFRRLDPKITSALGIQLEVLPSSGTLYINQSITLPYRVKNVGAGTATIKVSITDDKGFAQSPTSNTYPVPSNGTKRGSFVLKAGPIKGETTTVTISAKATGSANNKVQYNVQRITVEEKIIRVIDKTAPICNVTSIKGKCDFGADICQCSRQTWEMKAIVGDNGDGLLSVFSSGAGPNSTFTNDSFSVGHKLSNGVIHTTLSADCCHQKAKITVVDLAGNVGLCDVVITPGFVAPDPNLCISPVSSGKTKPVQTNANITSITCNITNIIDTCNGSSSGTGKACENEFWSTEAELGDEGFGRIQVAAVNAGRHANLTKLNNTVMLSTDCCHPDVYINVVDIAGHTGQCHAKIAVVTDRPKPVQTNANITSITCNITNIIDTCNGSSSGTGKACENEFWSTEAELGDEGFGRIQVAAVNAGRHANLTKLNNTVMLSTDCCHPDVYINVVDIAGHTGQCHAKIAVVTDTPKTSLDQSGSDPPPIGIIAGGAAGGIAVTGAVVGLVYYLKTRATAGKVGQDANAVTPAS